MVPGHRSPIDDGNSSMMHYQPCMICTTADPMPRRRNSWLIFIFTSLDKRDLQIFHESEMSFTKSKVYFMDKFLVSNCCLKSIVVRLQWINTLGKLEIFLSDGAQYISNELRDFHSQRVDSQVKSLPKESTMQNYLKTIC